MVQKLVLAAVLFCVSTGASSFYSNTGIRVLLERSDRSVLLQSVQPAAVRIDDQLKTPRLSPGLLIFSPAAGARVQMVRIPYRPLVARTVELVWPLEKPGLRWDGKLYRGRARFENSGKALSLVNHLPLETYLAGTVGGEMNASWSLEALKAQAVAARSYALYRTTHPRDPFFDLKRTTDDQVYLGMQGESVRAWRAVRETQGYYLTTSQKPGPIFYHSRCGGDTEAAEGVWGTRGNRGSKGATCQFCRKNAYRWAVQWDAETFARKLGLNGARFSFHPEVVTHGRVAQIRIQDDRGSRPFTGEALRRLLGFARLKSTRFTFRQESGQVFAEGVGAGHGVGMCQWGAKDLAERGRAFQGILSHYYPGHSLRVWDLAEKRMDSHPDSGLASANAFPRGLRFSSTGGANRPASRFAP